MGSLSLLSRRAFRSTECLALSTTVVSAPPVFHLQVQVGHTARDFPVRHTTSGTAGMHGFEGLSSA